MPEFFSTSSVPQITGVIGGLFGSLKPLIFLVLGVFIAIWLFEMIINLVRQRAESAGSDLTGSEMKDLKEYAKLGKHFGQNIDVRALKQRFAHQRSEKRFLALKKKFGTAPVAGESDVPIRVLE
jgi:hypothetical protein